jgi:hypothetical protein
MSYNISLTNGTTIATIADGSYDSTNTSLKLVGRNYSNYGQLMTDNLVRLLENFSSTSAPGHPLRGQLWWNTTLNSLQVYYKSGDGLTAGWKPVSGAYSNSVSPTVAPLSGDFWWDSNNQQLNVYNGTGWVIVGPGYKAGLGMSGAIWEQITDTSLDNHDVVSIYLDGVRTAIISQDLTFTPNVPITGFSTIKAGYNMNTDYAIWGTANNASYLGAQPAANYWRTNQNNTGTGTLSVVNDTGITVGVGSDLTLSVDGTDAQIFNNTSGGDVSIYANVAGTSSRYIYINGATGAVEVAGTPSTTLGVATKGYVDALFNDTTLTGTPVAPTAAPGTNTTQLATTAFVYQSNVGLKSYVDAADALKATIASPTFTGTPLAPTATPGINTTQLATTAFVYQANAAMTSYVLEANVGLKSYVDTADALKATIASPTFTGNPAAPTPSIGDNDTSIATTAFVYQANLAMTGFVTSTYAPLASPTLTGTPLSTTAAAGTNTTQIATTAFVYQANLAMTGYVSGTYAPLASPTFTGDPTAPTPAAGDNDTSIATTAFVVTAINEVNANVANIAFNRISQGNSSLTILDTGSGNITLTLDGNDMLTATTSGVILKSGATMTATPSQTSTDTGNTAIATTSYVKTASTWWGNSSSRSAKFISTSAPTSGDGNNGDIWFQLAS